VALTFLSLKISPCAKPDAFSTDIVFCVGVCIPPGFIDEPVRTVELAIYSSPPTAFTVSFSKTAVFRVPLILAFSTSKKPPSSAVSLNPLPAKFS